MASSATKGHPILNEVVKMIRLCSGGLWWGRLETTLVAQQCPQDVDAAACQGEDGLGMAFAFGSLAVVEGVRDWLLQRMLTSAEVWRACCRPRW